MPHLDLMPSGRATPSQFSLKFGTKKDSDVASTWWKVRQYPRAI